MKNAPEREPENAFRSLDPSERLQLGGLPQTRKSKNVPLGFPSLEPDLRLC